MVVLTFFLVYRHRCLGTLWQTGCCRFLTELSVSIENIGTCEYRSLYNNCSWRASIYGDLIDQTSSINLPGIMILYAEINNYYYVITFSFWYAVTAMNSVSLNTYVRKVEYGNLIMSLALTRWKRGWYLCIEFNMV